MKFPLISIYVALRILERFIEKISGKLRKIYPFLGMPKLFPRVAAVAMFFVCIFALTITSFNNKNNVYAAGGGQAGGAGEQYAETLEPINWKADVAAYDELFLVEYEKAEVLELTPNSPTEIVPLVSTISETTTLTTAPATTTQVVVSTSKTITTSVIAIESPPEIVVPETPVKETVSVVSGEFNFTTYGWGHGVGLSQNGANFYATYGGYNYRQILEHYYPGITIINDGETYVTFTIGGVSYSALDAVAGVVANEMGYSMHPEAMKAQAVAAYTNIKFNKGNGTGMIWKQPTEEVYALVSEVLGEACFYDNQYCCTVFCASSGGATANCGEIYVQDLPYLRSVVGEFDEAYDPHYGTVKAMSAEVVREKIQSYFDITLSDDPANWFTIAEVGGGGYINKVNIDGQLTVKGTAFKSALSLKSSKFEIEYGY